MGGFINRIILSILGGAIIMALFCFAEHRRIRWERSRGLYAREAHTFYLRIRSMAESLWGHGLPRLVLIAGAAVFLLVSGLRIRAVIFDEGVRRESARLLSHKGIDEEKYSEADLAAWVSGLEKVLASQGLPAYCSKIRSEMALLSEIPKRTVFEQVKMRSLSQDWMKRCEVNKQAQ